MSDQRTNRRLAAILAADVVGYSRLMAADESGTLTALKRHRETSFDPAVERFGGRIVKLIGDGTLVEFASVVDAVNCALAIQAWIASGTEAGAGSPPIVLRIGINLGDVIIDGDDIYGDGVNIAARLEPLAKPGGICISSIVNESARGRIDAAFSDGGEVAVKNIDRPIRVWMWHPAETGAGAPDATAAPSPAMTAAEPTAAAPKAAASIAVLPFQNMSGDAEQEYFSDGISEDIITDLSKVSGLLVIARNSTFAYKGRSVDLRTVARELGVGTVLEGSVRRAGNRVRITAQLIDAATGGHLWAERYDRDLTDIFAVQDEVTLAIVDALKVQLAPGEEARIASGGTDNSEAYDLFLRARDMLIAPHLDAALLTRIRDHAERAIGLAPDFSPPYAVLAMCGVMDHLNRWTDEAGTALERALEPAERAVTLDPDDPYAHHAAAVAFRLAGNRERSEKAIEAALAINPNYATALLARGINGILDGKPLDGIPYIERAIRLDPSFSHQYLHHLGVAHLLAGHNETAAMVLKERLILARDSDISRAMLAAALGHLGEVDEARQVWRDLMAIDPDFDMKERIGRLPYKDETVTQRVFDGLARAGLPEAATS